MSLMNSYLQVISEGKASAEVKSNLKAGSDFFGNKPKNEDDTLENVDKLDKPTAGLSQGAEPSKPKPLNVKFEAKNPFDDLFNKVLAQENLGWEDEAQAEEEGDPNTSLSFAGDTSTGEGEVEMGEEEGEEGEEEGGEGDPMQEVLDALKAAVSALERVLGSEEEEEEEDPLQEEGEDGGEGMEDSEGGEGSEEETPMEAVDAEEVGHALVDLEKLAASLNSPKSQVVKGAVPVNKGKAQVPKGGKHDGSLSELGDQSDKLENKKNSDTGLVKTGKTIFEQ